jgi:hypothetical protein
MMANCIRWIFRNFPSRAALIVENWSLTRLPKNRFGKPYELRYAKAPRK